MCLGSRNPAVCDWQHIFTSCLCLLLQLAENLGIFHLSPANTPGQANIAKYIHICIIYIHIYTYDHMFVFHPESS